MVGFAPIRIGAEFDGNLPKVCSGTDIFKYLLV